MHGKLNKGEERNLRLELTSVVKCNVGCLVLNEIVYSLDPFPSLILSGIFRVFADAANTP
jgi:hypothetical protein